MLSRAVVILVVVLAAVYGGQAFTLKAADGCSASLNDASFPEPDPLLLRPGVTYDDVADYETAFILPDDTDGILRIAAGQQVRVACPGGSLTLTGKEEETATCKGSDLYQVGSSTVAVGKLACSRAPFHVAIRKDKCATDGTGVNIGFQLDTIYPLIYTCFNEKTMQTYWSKERVTAELKGYESGEDSPSFIQDDFYPGLAVNTLYTYDNQVVAFTKLLGSKDLALKYLKDRNNYFLARGHLAPRADGVFGAHTRATYHFINCNPQWQIFNGGVWEQLESATRNFAINSDVDLISYTGPMGVLSLPDTNNNQVPLYLANPGTTSQALPVPKFYWKIVYEPESKRGVAFVGINNPFVAIPYPKDYQLCTDVLSKIQWTTSIKNTTWLYACEVEEFLQLDTNIPKLDISGLLTN